jgi:hemolysin III
MGVSCRFAWAALQPALIVGQLPLVYRTGFGTGPERHCPTPTRANETALAQSQPGILGYLDSCSEYGLQPSPDVLNQLDVGLSSMSIRSSFGNLDLRALVLLLLDRGGHYLSRLRSLDLSRAHLDASSMLLVAQLLLHPSCALETLDLSHQEVGLEGACAVGSAIRASRTLRDLRLAGCDLFDEGGQVMLDLLRNTSLQTVDLQNNIIEFVTCQAILEVADERAIDVDLDGNRVFDEVFNAVTHLIGVGLGITGMVLLLLKVRNKPDYYKCSVAIYCVSATMLYLFSTLYHSFFALGRTTVEVFRTLDYCGIFLLISGTYTPLFVVLFHGEWWAKALIRGMWISSFLGISVAAFYRGPGETPLRLTFFLVMGWTCVAVIREIIRELGREGTLLLLGGGILYSAGVPFFVRGGHVWEIPDHSIWHLFVLAASTCHYFAIYWYVADRPVRKSSENRLDEAFVTASSDSSDDEITVKANGST